MLNSNTSIKGKKYSKNKKNKHFFYKFFKIVFTFPTYLYIYDALLTPSYHLLLIKPKKYIEAFKATVWFPCTDFG